MRAPDMGSVALLLPLFVVGATGNVPQDPEYKKAIAKARDEKQDDVAKGNSELLELYRSGKPYREKWG